ncbi:MAG: cyclodeaminase/cyclohydrolase family protein, partial [Acidimicrobiia bacterium]
VLSEGTLVSRIGAGAASSDVGVGVELIAAALRGAALNVWTNLTSQPETDYSSRVRADMERLKEKAHHEIERAREQLA